MEEDREDEGLVHEQERIVERYHHIGYREGLFMGKEETIQDAFDRGFYYSALTGFMNAINYSGHLPESDSLDDIKASHEEFKSYLGAKINDG